MDVLPAELDLTLADLSPGMVQEAIERCKSLPPFHSVSGQQADAAALPFRDDSFDAAVAMHMLYHVAEPEVAIREMFRILKPGGTLAVTTNGTGNMREIYELTAVFGSAPTDPSAATFSYDTAEAMMRKQFGNQTMSQHPATLQVTSREDVFSALTSYPPGENASEAQLVAFRAAIDRAFEQGNGTRRVQKQSGLFLSREQAEA